MIFSFSPVSKTFDPERGFDRLPLPGFGGLSAVPRAQIERRFQPVTQRLNEVVRHSGAEVISPMDYLCDREECPALDKDGSPIYRDNGHIRASKAETLATFVDDVLRPHDP